VQLAQRFVVNRSEIGHGEAVCRIIGDRKFDSLAPGADVCFVESRGVKGGVRIADVNSAILNLARKRQVDLINVSSGCSLPNAPDAPDHPLADMREVIEQAADLGTLCIAASGNDYDEPVVAPAIFDACVAVGAVGRTRSAPSSSAAHWWISRTELVGHPDGSGHSPFHWKPSGRGRGLNLLAPGVGVLVARDGRLAYDVVGTSFAAPVACGALAAALARDTTYLGLPRNRKRADHARSVLLGLCKTAGFPHNYEGAGVLMA
jgi:subtilisin